jgi:hypothetical protein
MIIGMKGLKVIVNYLVVNGEQIKVETSLTNPSLIEIELGDIHLNVTYEDKKICKELLFPNFILKAGKQELPISCELNFLNISTLLSNIVTEKEVKLKVTIKQAQPVPWLQSALEEIDLSAKLTGMYSLLWPFSIIDDITDFLLYYLLT